jgi:effector-binding domain-containing protein
MRNKKFPYISLVILSSLAIFLASCSNPEQTAAEEKKIEEAKRDSMKSEVPVPKKFQEFRYNQPGPIGVFAVPEMLTLCVRDSADAAHMAEAFARAYTILQNEMKSLDLKPDGAPGSLYYNNDPNNFIFECVYPIAKMPAKNPKKCKVVVLEASNMFIYHYYGPYADLYKAYDSIKEELKNIGLEQSGPMREFYMTADSAEKDPAKWLTRIMVPVMPKNPVSK